MEISCPECQKRFLVPDEKLPADTKAVLTCPNCKGKIPVDTTEQTGKDSPSSETSPEGVIEFFEEGVKRGLVCVPDKSQREGVISVLGELGYRTSTANDLDTFYTKVRYNHYDLIVASDRFPEGGIEKNPILKYLERLPMSIRRNIFLMLISAQHRTLDTLTAFSLSVDAIINESDLGRTQELLRKSLVQHRQFYRVFKDCLRAEGRV